MNKSESDRIQDLCAQIAVEEDRAKFLKLVQELNRVLSTKDPQIQNDKPSDPKSNRVRHLYPLPLLAAVVKNNML